MLLSPCVVALHEYLLLVPLASTGDSLLKRSRGAPTEGEAASHLCDVLSCQLPAADWYVAKRSMIQEANKAGPGSAGGATPSSGG